MTTDNKYNGWTNYATWRVNLELIDGYYIDEANTQEVADIANNLREYAEECVSLGQLEGSLALSYALAFLDDVNWHEIATHFIENHEQV